MDHTTNRREETENVASFAIVTRLEVRRSAEYVRAHSLTEAGRVTWALRLVEIRAEDEGPRANVVEISWPDGLVDIADLGLTLAEAKLVLAGMQREICHRISDRRDGRLDGIAIALKPVGTSKNVEQMACVPRAGRPG